MSSCVRVPLSPARDRYQTRRWAACSLQQAIQIAPSERSGHKSRSAPEHARSTVPARPARILVLEGDHPGGTERARRRRWPPNMQPRIVTPHVSASPAPSARRTGVRCGNHPCNESEKGRSPRARPTSRHFEDRLEDVSYFLSYNYPIRVGMAHHEGRTVRLAMALRITCRMDRSDLHHLRGDLRDPAADHRPGHLRGAHQVADLGSSGHAIGSFAALSPRFREPGLATGNTFRGLLREI